MDKYPKNKLGSWPRVRWRVQGIPPGVNKVTLAKALANNSVLLKSIYVVNGEDLLGWKPIEDVAVLTLASDIRTTNPKQTATVQFRSAIPEELARLPQRGRLAVTVEFSPSCSARITIDRHFLGLTILHSPTTSEYPVVKQVNILAVSGLGGHALGSFISKNDHDHMWLVDSLCEDIPWARVMIYGYDSTLGGSTSFATVRDLAGTLYMPMRDILLMHQSTIPLIVIAHSLGGLLVKDLFIRMGQYSESELLQSVAGVLFFGVPHNGMDIASFTAIVGDRPNRHLLESISKTDSSMLLAQRQDFSELLGKTEFEVFCFYETEFSPTAKLLCGGRFEMTGTPCCLVDVNSATSCFRGENSGDLRQIAVAKTHSDLVKFEMGDSDYENVRGVIERIYTRSMKPG